MPRAFFPTPPSQTAAVDPALRVFTLSETCRILRLAEPLVRKLITSGELPACRFGRVWRIRQDAIEELLELRETS